MISVNNLTKAYGRHLAVDDCSFQVEKGEIVGFLGPNGAGKTTTMRVLTCFLPATSGGATIAGYDIFEQSREVRQRLGYLPENVPLYLDLSVEEYLGYMGRLRGLRGEELKRRLNEVLANCGVEHRRRDLIGKLSRGYRQRVGLAQALLHTPEVVILDEPTASLDPAQIREIREYIKSLAGDHTIILSTHILPEVELTCDRVLMINKGRIVANDTPHNLRGYAGVSQVVEIEARGVRAELEATIRTLPQVKSISGDTLAGADVHRLRVESEQDLRGELARAVVNGGFDLYRLDQATRSLEDIFVELTTEEVAQPVAAEVA